MTTKPAVLKVLMNGVLVGLLEKEKHGGLSFTYADTWLERADARPISLSLPLVKKRYQGDIVYNFFDNLLPDNPKIRAKIQAKFHLASSQPFDLLSAIGHDCVGAIQLTDEEVPVFDKKIKAKKISNKQIANILKNIGDNPLGMQDDNDDFRISLAGVQEKTAFLQHNKTWYQPIAETPTSHIFKLPIGEIETYHIDLSQSCENEWLCMQILKAFDMPVADCEIKDFAGSKVLVVKRFDRRLSKDKKWLMRLPQEDLCQALGYSPNLKYQADGGPGIREVMRFLLGSANAAKDRDMFFKSQILFYVLAAIDGHAKNFSVLVEPEGRYRLTPLYDVISAYPMVAAKQLQKQKIKMAMALSGESGNHYRWHDIQARHFLATAKASGYSKENAKLLKQSIVEQIDPVIEIISKALPTNFPKNIAQPIFAGMREAKKRLND